MIDKVFLPFYNEGELGGVEMHPGLNKYMMQLRMESKEKKIRASRRSPLPMWFKQLILCFLEFHIKRVTAAGFYWPNKKLTGTIGIS